MGCGAASPRPWASDGVAAGSVDTLSARRGRAGARLLSFTDGYIFEGLLESQCRQIGNAVPPRLAHVLGVALAEALTTPAK